MEVPGLLVYLLACATAALLTRYPLSLRASSLALAAFTLFLGLPIVWIWLATDGVGPALGKRPVQYLVIAMHGLFIALLPSGLMRPFDAYPWTSWGALTLALALPWLCVFTAAFLGVDHGVVSSGTGHLGELLFLDPMQMGEGVTWEGVVPHRFRVHYLAMVGMVLGALLLHFLPARRKCTMVE